MDSNSLQAPIRKLNPHQPITCESRTPAREAIATMQEKAIGCVMVVREGHLVGILSERDVVRKLHAQNFEPGALAVEALMTEQPDALHLDDSVAFAMNRMHVSGYRHIPLVDADERPVGIISIKDLIRYVVEELGAAAGQSGAALPMHQVTLDDENLDDELSQMAQQAADPSVRLSSETFALPLSKVASHSPITVTTDTSLREAAALMVQRKISSVPVVEGMLTLRGIFTDKDVLMKMAGRDLDMDKVKMSEVMHPSPQTLALDDPLEAALRLMHKGHYRHVPLVDGNGRLVGMVSVRDIIGYIAAHFLGDILNLPPTPVRRAMHATEGA